MACSLVLGHYKLRGRMGQAQMSIKKTLGGMFAVMGTEVVTNALMIVLLMKFRD